MKLTLFYDDEDTRAVTLPDVPDDAVSLIKSKIVAVNNGTAQNVADMRTTFVSEGGGSFVSISAAELTTTTEEVIYDG